MGAWIVEICDGAADRPGQGGAALALCPQIDQPIIQDNFCGRDEAETTLWLWRAIKTKPAKAMTYDLEGHELTKGDRL